MIRRVLVLFCVTLCVTAHSSHLYAMGAHPPRETVPVRVLIARGDREVSLRVKGHYQMVNFETGEVLKEGRSLQGLTIAVKDIVSEGIKILPSRRARVYINGRQFRGIIDIIKNDNELLAVNHIDIEQYLYGVLYHEVSHRWPIEVLKAQAIAARTYALYQKLVGKGRYFDLTSDVYSQVYGGRTSEKWRTTRAVNLTQRQVLTYGGRLFPSYYHATCGGHTSAAGTLWNIDVPALRGRVCPFCKISPHYEWKKELEMDDVRQKLRESGYKIQVVSIEVVKRDNAGRVLDLLLKGRENSVTLSGNKFRLMIGPNIIKSTNFEIAPAGKYVTFYGKGWGHGIGMCQWGAYHMARQGWKAEDIVGYYYPGAEIVEFE